MDRPDAPELEIGKIGDLAEQMVYRLSGCDDLMISKTLQVAFAEFARTTCCFVTFQNVETEKDELVYPIANTIPGMLVSAISEVRLDGRVLENPRQYTTQLFGSTPFIHLNPSVVDFGSPCVEDHRDPSDPVSEREIRHVAEHRRHHKQKLRIRCIEIPRIGSENAPKWFLDKYGEAVVALALFRLFSMTGKAWSDQAQAQAELVRYENFCTNARLNSFSYDGSQCGNSHVDPLDTSTLL